MQEPFLDFRCVGSGLKKLGHEPETVGNRLLIGVVIWHAILHARHKGGSLGQAYPSAERMQLSKLSSSNGLLR